MKTRKRVLALLVTAVMVLSLAPAPAFAATNDITAATVNSVNVFGKLFDASTKTNVSELGAPESYTVNVPLTPANAAAEAAGLVDISETDGTKDAKVTYYPGGTGEAATIANIMSDGNLKAAELPSNTHFAVGDVLWISDGADQMLRVLFVTPSEGEIEGEGTLEEVAFKVMVPLVVDFAIDPGELNLEGVQIFGADYAVINKTPNYAVQVKFAVRKPSEGGTIQNVVGDFNPGTRQSRISVVNAASVTLKDTNTAFDKAIYESAEVGTVARELDTKRRTVAVGAAAANNNASTPVDTAFVLDKYGTTAQPASALTTANVGAFTFRGELNQPETLTYDSGDVKLVAAYSLTGVGLDKYASDAPALQGANAKALAIAGYGFDGTAIAVSANGVAGATAGTVNNAKHTDKTVSGNPVAGEFTINIAKATGFTATTQFALLNNGASVQTVWYGEPGSPFSDNTSTMVIDETSVSGTSILKFGTPWYGTGDAVAGTYYQFIEMDNGDIFMITIVVA
jgi:hypothetical protein